MVKSVERRRAHEGQHSGDGGCRRECRATRDPTHRVSSVVAGARIVDIVVDPSSSRLLGFFCRAPFLRARTQPPSRDVAIDRVGTAIMFATACSNLATHRASVKPRARRPPAGRHPSQIPERDRAALDFPPSSLASRCAASAAAVALTLTLAASPASAGLFDPPEEKDPVEPFSVFGTVYKKYVIDVLDEATGRQIVGRKRGFTAEACVDVISERQQRFRVPGEGGSLAPGGPTVAAVASAGAASGNYASESVPVQRSRVCTERVVEGSISKTDEMLPACVPACRSSCARAISAYDAEQRRTVGFGFTEKDAARVKGSCAAQCEKNCVKSGKSYDFIIPFRL